MEEGFVYLLESIRRQKRYLGSTNNPAKKIKEHNSKKVVATKLLAPWKCVLVVNVGRIDIARKIESYIKNRKQKLSTENVISNISRYYKQKISSVLPR